MSEKEEECQIVKIRKGKVVAESIIASSGSTNSREVKVMANTS